MKLKILLYFGTGKDKVEPEPILLFLSDVLPTIPVEGRPDFFSYFLNLWGMPEEKIMAISRALAMARVFNPYLPGPERQPLYGEINFERRFLLAPEQRPSGILYDAGQLQKILRSLITPEENNWSNLHLVITNQLIGTWDQANKCYHYRTAFFGFPSIISTTGLVAAPAKPRDFYIKLKMGLSREAVKNEFRDYILDYDDPRLTEIIKGHILQALFYQLTADPFCSHPYCRLYNAHWQEEMIKAQIQPGLGLCPNHLQIIKQFLEGEIKDEWLIKY